MRKTPTIQKMGPLVFFLAITAFSLVFVLTGCDNGPLSIDQAEPQDETSFFDQPYDPDAIAKGGLLDVESSFLYEGYATVEDGGVVLLGSTDAVERLDTDYSGTDASELVDAFVVQPLSISVNTTIVVQVTTIIADDGEVSIVFDCSPDGLVFTSPAILLLNAWENFGKNATHVNLYWLNEETNEWQLEAEAPVDELTGQVAFQIHHFSGYGAGMSSDPKGGGGGTTTPGEGKPPVGT